MMVASLVIYFSHHFTKKLGDFECKRDSVTKLLGGQCIACGQAAFRISL